jgi:predicted ATPase
LKYKSGLIAHSWILSDGTLRLLALNLLAYAPKTPNLMLIEEHENGIHPKRMETVMQSLSSVYDV